MKQTSEQQSLTHTMGIDAQDQAKMKAFVDFDEADARELKALLPEVSAAADAIVDQFYSNIQRYPELMQVINDAGSNIDRLKAAQKRYLLELFEGDYGDSYFERRLRIGVVHNRIGLTPRWYLGSYSVYVQAITPIIMRKYRFNMVRRNRAVLALNKIISIDSELAINTYIHGMMTDLKGISMSKGEIEARVKSYAAFIEDVAHGNLKQRVIVAGSDELAQLGGNLNSMTESLQSMAREVGTASNAMFSTLAQMQGAISAQSAGAAEQAAAVNQTTATMEEIKQMAAQTLAKTQDFGTLAERTRREGEQGLQTLEQASRGMEAIRQRVEAIAQTILALSEQTQQIGEITAVVTGLAQQSKMLALNASIEAAKAGEAGKGFAVVAAEVKELAEQSQQSTAQVQKILQDIRHATDRAVMATEEGSKGVDAGVVLVQKSGEVMRQLNEVIREGALASQQIIAAVKQKFVGIEQVSLAMGEINKVTGQFVASTQQTKEAASNLTEVAGKLKDSVGVYKT
ncbi:MAG: protoglobin domain-containing protein [Rhodocyclaceae bacterium]|nr:protoglobin domain-containing protein [Rhodocyclaceae bacterium]